MAAVLPSSPFGALANGAPATLFTLGSAGLIVRVTDYGARMVAIEAPDRDGAFGHVLLGFDDVAAYDAAGGSFGAVLGRCANRIGGGRFMLDGVAHQLAVNDGGNTLHGGPDGFAQKLWQVERASDGAAPELALSLVSPAGDQGFPGSLTARVVYSLCHDTLSLELTATTDAPTIVNLSSHPYFNLAGVGHDVLGHDVMINAWRTLMNDPRQIPTGAFAEVAGTPFDFRTPRSLTARIREADPQLLSGRGYDNCFVLEGEGMRFAARVREAASGRTLEVATTQPGLQLYSGNSLDGSVVGRGGVALRQSAGFALEAQNFPDAVNHPNFPSPVLRPGEIYRQKIAYRFYA